ncbi:MAG: hypothetical protein LBF67_03345 [Prevotellaceae bacterium]|jgi:hypothetical protein|nr:hypothetical protein [Prevotellaceae bacterium]
MKKLLFLLLLATGIAPFTLNAANTTLEDTSLVRISTAEARADFLSRMMKERLDLDPEEFAAIQSINMKYEELLQELTLSITPTGTFGGPKKKKGDSLFDKLSEARDKEVKKALSGRHYREYDKQRWGMRNALKKQMLIEKEEQDKKLYALQQQEKARADSIAAAEKAAQKPAAKKKSGAKKTKKKKK